MPVFPSIKVTQCTQTLEWLLNGIRCRGSLPFACMCLFTSCMFPLALWWKHTQRRWATPCIVSHLHVNHGTRMLVGKSSVVGGWDLASHPTTCVWIWLYHLANIWPLASDLLFLSLSFLVCKVGIIIMPSSWES